MTQPNIEGQEHGVKGAASAGQFPATTRVITLLVIIAVFVVTQLYAAIPLIGPVSQALGGDATVALSTLFSLCYALGFLFWGPVSDHFGRRPVMVVGLIVLTAITAACAFAPSISALGVLRALQGFTAASFAPVALAYLAEATPPARRATAIGAMSTAFLVAGIAGQVGASVVALRFGWSWVFLASACVLLVGFVGVLLFVREPHTEARPGGLGASFAAIGRVMVNPRVLLLGAAQLTLLLSFVAMYTGFGPHAASLGMAEDQLIWLRLIGLPGMFATWLVAPLSRRFSIASIARAGFVIAALGIVCEAALSFSLVGVALASMLFVTGIAISIPPMITLFGETAAPHRAGGMALNGLMLFLGASLGPVVASAGLGFQALTLTLAGLLLLAAVWLTLFKRVSARDAR